MVKRIEERTKGAVKITLFPDSALGTSPEQADQVRRGLIDFGDISPGAAAPYNAAVGMLNTPYVFDNYQHVWKFFDGAGKEWMKREFEKAGFVYLEAFEWGFRAMTNNARPITTPDDVKGLRMRTPPELALQAVYQALDASPQAINYQETYVALATKTVDGQCNPLSNIHAAKFYEVQKYLGHTNHQYTASLLLANPRSWAKLPPEQQQIVREEVRKAALEARAAVVEKDAWYLEEMKKAGVQISEPDVGAFRAKMGPAYERIKAGVGAATFDEVIALAQKAREAP